MNVVQKPNHQNYISPHNHYIRHFIDVTYWTLYSPFRLKYDENKNTFVIHSNRIQKTLCIILQIMSLIVTSRMIPYAFKFADTADHVDSEQRKPFFAFRSFNILGKFSIFYIFIWTLWSKQAKILKFTTFSYYENYTHEQSKFVKQGGKQTKTRLIIWAIIACIVMLAILPAFVNDDLFLFRKSAEIISSWDSYWTFIAKGFYLDPKPEGNNLINILNYIMTIICFGLTWYLRIGNHVVQAMGLLAAFTCLRISKRFSNILRNGAYLYPQQVIREYTRSRNQIKMINEITELNTFGFVFFALPHFVLGGSNILGSGSLTSQIQFACYLSFYFSLLLIAVQATLNMNDFKEWIFEYQENTTLVSIDIKIYQIKLNAALTEISQQQVGMGGRYFVINSNFVGTIFGLVLTYSIILMQLHSTSSNEKCNIN